MILIYGKGKVGNALKNFCDYNDIKSEIKDDNDKITDFSKYSKIIPSPGVSPANAIYKTGKVVGELDFIYSYLPKGFKIISITGTDGKSTTVWITYNLLKQEFQNKIKNKESEETNNSLISGKSGIFLSGNFDIPFSETVLEIQKKELKSGIIVMEISSFMAYNVKKFKSDYSIFTNFEVDHLNWHHDMADYFNSKLNILRNTTKKSIVNTQILEKAQTLGLKFNIKNTRFFSMQNDKSQKDRIEMPYIIVSGKKKYYISETNFSGIYNAMNILCSTIVTNEMKICSKRTKEYLKNIYGLSHRIEFYKEINGIKFIDDSKSTSAQSLKAGLESFPGNIILIAGGSDKGDTFDHLGKLFKEKVKHAELIGQTREIIGKVFESNKISFHYSDSMDEAVKNAYKNTTKGDVVLLSPGCASFGLFKDYLDRANKFREGIDKLEKN